jgi:mono/diheme cytochrome c family protein
VIQTRPSRFLLAAVLVTALAARLDAQAPRDTARSSADGVYTLAQAIAGKDVFATFCQSCHTPTVHAGPPFRKAWFGRSLAELFGYLRREMPKSDPGSMSDEEYALVLAYLLRINDMKPGITDLAADSVALHRIRLDSVASVPTAPHSDTRR